MQILDQIQWTKSERNNLCHKQLFCGLTSPLLTLEVIDAALLFRHFVHHIWAMSNSKSILTYQSQYTDNGQDSLSTIFILSRASDKITNKSPGCKFSIWLDPIGIITHDLRWNLNNRPTIWSHLLHYALDLISKSLPYLNLSLFHSPSLHLTLSLSPHPPPPTVCIEPTTCIFLSFSFADQQRNLKSKFNSNKYLQFLLHKIPTLSLTSLSTI